MVDIKKHEWKPFSVSREYSVQKAALSTGSKAECPVLPSATAHSEHQNFELQNFMLRKGPQGYATQTNGIFECVLFFCEVDVPPRREYGWTKLIRIQAKLLQGLPNYSFLFFIWLSLLQHLTIRYPFLTVWNYSFKINTVVSTNRWEQRQLSGNGLRNCNAESSKALARCPVLRQEFAAQKYLSIVWGSQASPNRIDNSLFYWTVYLGSYLR